MANIVTQLDELTCPNISGFKLGTWLQSVYTALAGGTAGSSTALSALQSCRTLLNEIRGAWSTNYATLTSGRTLGNELKTVVNTVKTLANELRTDSTTNAAAVTGMKVAMLNCSTTKAGLAIGTTNPAQVRAAATTTQGIIAGVFYACAATEAAFSSPTDSFAPAATCVSRAFTFSYTASGTLTHSTGATISGTATAPTAPRPVANTFPVGVVVLKLKAGTATRFNGGTTTLGNTAITDTYTDYSFIPGYVSDYAAPVSAAAITAVVSADISYPAPSTISAAMSTPGNFALVGSVSSLNIDESAISW